MGWVDDAQLAFRRLVRDPKLTVLAVIMLSLGIGANTAIYSVVESIFLQPIPVHAPKQLVGVYTSCRAGDPRCSSSFPDYRDYRDQVSGLADLAAWTSGGYSVTGGEGPAERLSTYLVTGNYFSVLGLAPAAGRLLIPGDHSVASPVPIVVLSYSTWQQRFGGDPSAVGKTLNVNGVELEIVGVTPQAFRGTSLSGDPRLFIPITMGSLLGAGAVRDEGVFASRGNRWIQALVGRLAPGATVDRVQDELDALAVALNEAYPEERGTRFMTADPLHRYALPQFGREDLQRFVQILAGVVLMTLLLTCANLANLLLARATARRSEMGVRLALGAGRHRIRRQLLIESVMVSLLGTVAGIVVAQGLLQVLEAVRLPGGVTLAGIGVGLDMSVFAVATGLAVATGVLFGLAPAIRAARTDATASIRRELSRTRGESTLRKALVGVQVALCLVLLAGSVLFVQALKSGLDTDLGFEPEGLALVRFSLGDLGYEPSEAMGFLEQAQERVRGLPGVVDASYGSRVPLQVGGNTATFAEVEGYQRAPEEEIRLEYLFAGPGFLETLGVDLSAGADALAPNHPEGSILINTTMADRYWQDGQALNGTVLFGETPLRVFGITQNVQWRGIGDAPSSFALIPISASPSSALRPLTFAARTSGDPAAILPAVRSSLQGLDPSLTFFFAQTSEDLLGSALAASLCGVGSG